MKNLFLRTLYILSLGLLPLILLFIVWDSFKAGVKAGVKTFMYLWRVDVLDSIRITLWDIRNP